MSTSDPFLPIQGEEAHRGSHAPVQREDHDVEDESDVDVFFPTGAADDASADDSGEPPLPDHTFFRTPTGERADPAND